MLLFQLIDWLVFLFTLIRFLIEFYYLIFYLLLQLSEENCFRLLDLLIICLIREFVSNIGFPIDSSFKNFMH
jgi:hypothetical protein